MTCDMKIFIFGFGTMGRAIVQALDHNSKGLQVFVHDRSKKTIRHYKNLKLKEDNALKNLSNSDVVLIAVKPQDLSSLAQETKRRISKNCIILSIAAGVGMQKLAQLFNHRKIVRIMPNLGLSVGYGIAVWKAQGLSGGELKKIKGFLNQMTENFEVKNESLIDAATAVSGSGPAYFFYLANALTKAALALKLNQVQTRKLVSKTLYSAAFLQTEQSYEELINRVKSKKGTTEVALQVLHKHHADQIIQSAVKAAFKRAKELAHV